MGGYVYRFLDNLVIRRKSLLSKGLKRLFLFVFTPDPSPKPTPKPDEPDDDKGEGQVHKSAKPHT